MANAYTSLSNGAGTAATTGGLGGGQWSGTNGSGTFTPSNGAGLVQKAYDRLVEFQLRATPLIRSVADKRPVNQAMPGSSVALQIYNDLDKVSSALSEQVDPDAVALATPNVKTVTLNEYGNAALVTRALQLYSLADVDPAVANIVAFNMADSIDDIAQTALLAGTNVIRQGGANATTGVGASNIITAASVRKAVAKLRGNKAVARKGSMFWAGIHPEVSHDLRAETGGAAWRDPHNYQSNENIWAGEIGSFEGAYFVESPRLYTASDGASTTAANISSSSFSATTGATYTVTHALVAGDYVVISGFTGSAAVHNGTWKVTSVSTTTTFTIGGDLSTASTAGTPQFAKSTKVYRTFLAGQQALAEAVAEEPHVVIGPVTDKLNRFRPIGWYGVLGFSVYRDEALYRIESSSSIQV
jgi:N4-gp56 family major capsid protein